MAKRTWVSYILWLVGGTWGLHLFYLNRDRQAFVWFATFGCYGLGYVRDLFVIPRYVSEANDNEKTDWAHSPGTKNPPRSVLRFGLACTFGFTLGNIFQYCFPMELLELGSPPGLNVSTATFVLLNCLGPLGAIVGIHTVVNIGRQKCSLKYQLYPALAASGLYTAFLQTTNLTWLSVAATVVSTWKGQQWRTKSDRHRSKKSIKRRMFILVLVGLVYTALWLSGIYFNMSITTEHGEVIKVREAIDHFLESEFWADTKKVVHKLWEQYQREGYQRMWDNFITALDPQGESHAQKVLGVTSSTSEEELRKKYKALAREWHPDKHKDNKEEAARRFMEIQKAYERLSSIHAKRAARHARPPM